MSSNNTKHDTFDSFRELWFWHHIRVLEFLLNTCRLMRRGMQKSWLLQILLTELNNDGIIWQHLQNPSILLLQSSTAHRVYLYHTFLSYEVLEFQCQRFLIYKLTTNPCITFYPWNPWTLPIEVIINHLTYLDLWPTARKPRGVLNVPVCISRRVPNEVMRQIRCLFDHNTIPSLIPPWCMYIINWALWLVAVPTCGTLGQSLINIPTRAPWLLLHNESNETWPGGVDKKGYSGYREISSLGTCWLTLTESSDLGIKAMLG